MKILEQKNFVGLDLDTEEQMLDPTSYRNALNMRIGHEISDAGAVKSIRGNTKIDWDPPTGENQTIGYHEDGKNGRLIFFNWNGGGVHGIYYYNLVDGAVYTIIEGSLLNFEKNQFVTGTGVVNNLLFFNDGVNPPRTVTIGFDYKTLIDAGETPDIDLHHKPPQLAPTTSTRLDPTKAVNNVATDSFQFATRYEYLDDTLTPFSPLSETLEAFFQPDPYNPSGSPYTEITVTDPLTGILVEQIKAVQFAYQKNNDGNYFVFDRKLVADPVSFTASSTFFNDGNARAVGAAETAKLFESIPAKVRALGVTQNRLYLGNVTEGLTIDPDDAVLEANPVIGSVANPLYKYNGIYGFGVVWYNDRRNSSVKGFKNVEINKNWDNLVSYELDVTVTATPPPWATSYKIVRTRDKGTSLYAEVSANPLWYRSVFAEAVPFLFPYNDFVVIENSYYLRNIPEADDSIEKNKFSYLHLQLPKGMPFVPDRTMFVRILSLGTGLNPPPTKVERILDVRGDIIVVKPFDVQDWNALLGNGIGSAQFDIEIFKPNESDSDILYEVTPKLELSTLGTAIRVPGDTYRLSMTTSNNAPFSFYPKDSGIWNGSALTDTKYFEDATIYNLQETLSLNVYSPTPTLKDEEVDTTVAAENIIDVATITPSWIMNYEKIADNIGRPNAVLDEEETLQREGLLRYSNTFIEDSNINGLTSFEALNQYQLPVERSPIRKLQPVKNILLAILERETTSLYVGEGFIKEADGSDSLIKTSDVIGDDRVLSGSGNFGTINPESVVEHDGQVYWWDAYNGAVCRYTNAGVFPISEYGMSSFFRKVALDYLGVPVVGGYDPKYDEYILTFYPKDENFPGFTIMFDVRTERWISFMSFQPEMYGKLSNKFFSFVAGALYEHDTNSLYNNFYGTQRGRKLTFVSNQENNKIKVFTNIHMDADSITLDETSGTQVVVAWTSDKQTFIPAHEIINREGLYRSHIYGNILGDPAEDFRQGAPMRGHVLNVEINNNRDDKSLLRSANIVYHHSEYSN